MSFDDFKKLFKAQGERFIFMENGKPLFVLLTFDDYKKLASDDSERQAKIDFSYLTNQPGREVSANPIADVPSCSEEDLPLPEPPFSMQEPGEIAGGISDEEEDKELTLEDLPF